MRSEPCIALLRGALSSEEVAIDAAKSGDAVQLEKLLNSLTTSMQHADAALSSQRHHRERSSLLHWASCNGHTACAQVLIRHRANVDAHAVNGWTPLMAAVTSHEAGAVRLLCDARADLHLRDSNGRSALMHATKPTGSRQCAALLEAAAAEEEDRVVRRTGAKVKETELAASLPIGVCELAGTPRSAPAGLGGRLRALSARLLSGRSRDRLYQKEKR